MKILGSTKERPPRRKSADNPWYRHYFYRTGNKRPCTISSPFDHTPIPPPNTLCETSFLTSPLSHTHAAPSNPVHNILQTLPTELILEITDHIDAESLIKLHRTCRFFQSMITKEMLLKRLYQDEDDIPRYFEKARGLAMACFGCYRSRSAYYDFRPEMVTDPEFGPKGRKRFMRKCLICELSSHGSTFGVKMTLKGWKG